MNKECITIDTEEGFTSFSSRVASPHFPAIECRVLLEVLHEHYSLARKGILALEPDKETGQAATVLKEEVKYDFKRLNSLYTPAIWYHLEYMNIRVAENVFWSREFLRPEEFVKLLNKKSVTEDRIQNSLSLDIHANTRVRDNGWVEAIQNWSSNQSAKKEGLNRLESIVLSFIDSNHALSEADIEMLHEINVLRDHYSHGGTLIDSRLANKLGLESEDVGMPAGIPSDGVHKFFDVALRYVDSIRTRLTRSEKLL